jgi:hypothetical protein
MLSKEVGLNVLIANNMLSKEVGLNVLIASLFG